MSKSLLDLQEIDEYALKVVMNKRQRPRISLEGFRDVLARRRETLYQRIDEIDAELAPLRRADFDGVVMMTIPLPHPARRRRRS